MVDNGETRECTGLRLVDIRAVQKKTEMTTKPEKKKKTGRHPAHGNYAT